MDKVNRGSLSQVEKMNNQAFSLAERLIPSTYVQQGLNAKKSRENLIRHFIEHVSFVSISIDVI